MPDRVEDVAILIEGRRWRGWDSVEIERAIDSFSTVTFNAPFEPERAEFRSTFRPFSFKLVELYVHDNRVFNGVLLGVEPKIEPDSRTVEVSCYSHPAVIADCTMPASSFPLELNGLTLRQIAETLIEPFGPAVLLDGPEGAVFRRVAIKPDENVLQFLVTLAQQRELVITDTGDGAIRFLKSTSGGSPVAQLREGEPPLVAVSPTFSPQAYFSEITGIAKTRAGRLGSHYTVQNPWLESLRPHAFELADTDDPDVPTATHAKLGRMFGNMLAVTIEVPTWRDPRGQLWTPNTTLMLEAPGAMIYRATEFLIRKVTLRQTADSITSSLELALPGAFSGEAPTVLPWD